jgi:uncharacterized protein (TIGR03083 family)
MSTKMSDATTQQEMRRSSLPRRTAMRLAAEEYRRFADALAALEPSDWAKPTDCPAWDVRQLACHVVGMAELAAGMREGERQRKIAAAEAKRDGVVFIDALNALQVRERDDWTPAQVVAGARSVAPRAARGRRLIPFFVRRRPMPVPQVVDGHLETWALGFLSDTILTRDTWMHRMDVLRASGRKPVLTPDHDGRIVADVVQEWAQRHGRPYRLRLTGPAGGSWSASDGGNHIGQHRGQHIEMDAVQFCRVLSGRGSGVGLLATHVPF